MTKLTKSVLISYRGLYFVADRLTLYDMIYCLQSEWFVLPVLWYPSSEMHPMIIPPPYLISSVLSVYNQLIWPNSENPPLLSCIAQQYNWFLQLKREREREREKDRGQIQGLFHQRGGGHWTTEKKTILIKTSLWKRSITLKESG